MLRTHLLTLDKKVLFFLSGVPVCFSPAWGKFYKKWRHCRWPLCSMQPSWAKFNGTGLHFHSNWGMVTVAKCEVIFHDTQYYLWKKALCLCYITVTSSGDTTVLELKATVGWGLLHETPMCLLSLPLHMEIQVNHCIQINCGNGRPTSFPSSLLVSCALLPLTPPSPLTVLVTCEGAIKRTS